MVSMFPTRKESYLLHIVLGIVLFGIENSLDSPGAGEDGMGYNETPYIPNT